MIVNLSPDMPVLGSSSSVANQDMIAKIKMNGDRIICLSRKLCGKRRNCSLQAISPFPQCFQKQFVDDVVDKNLWSKGLDHSDVFGILYVTVLVPGYEVPHSPYFLKDKNFLR